MIDGLLEANPAMKPPKHREENLETANRQDENDFLGLYL